MDNPLVIYHADCADGFCCAWLLHHAYPNAEFHAAQYDSAPPPPTAGRDVFVVDFCYSLETMMAMIDPQSPSACESLTLIDHHQSNKEKVDAINHFLDRWEEHGIELPISVVFQMDSSAARLVWVFLSAFPTNEFSNKFPGLGLKENWTYRPWLVNYTQDRDLWQCKLPHSHEINAALRSYPMTFEWWDKLHERDPGKDNGLAIEGCAILRREKQIVDTHVRNAVPMVIDGYEVLGVNATVLISEIAHELSRGRPFGVCWFQRQDGKRVYSLRSDRDGLDVSEVAKQHGGGGHEHAAGYTE